VASYKPAYLIHGDDHGRIGERRTALRALAERESGSGGVECFEGAAATPEAIEQAFAVSPFAATLIFERLPARLWPALAPSAVISPLASRSRAAAMVSS